MSDAAAFGAPGSRRRKQELSPVLAALKTAEVLATAPDPAACIGVFKTAAANFQVSAFACGEVDLAERRRCVFYAVDWPDKWRQFYRQSELVERDPLLEALQRHSGPFSMSELQRKRKMAVAGSEAIRMAAQEGWVDVLAVPVSRGGERFGLTTLFFPYEIRDAGVRASLATLSRALLDRLRYFAPTHGFFLPPAGLTPREIECLQLIARGGRDQEAAKTLGISSSTVNEHIEKAKAKLNAATRAQAIAVAVSLAIIAP